MTIITITLLTSQYRLLIVYIKWELVVCDYTMDYHIKGQKPPRSMNGCKECRSIEWNLCNQYERDQRCGVSPKFSMINYSGLADENMHHRYARTNLNISQVKFTFQKYAWILRQSCISYKNKHQNILELLYHICQFTRVSVKVQLNHMRNVWALKTPHWHKVYILHNCIYNTLATWLPCHILFDNNGN